MFISKKNAIKASSKVVHCLVSICFLINLVLPSQGFAQALNLPQPGSLMPLSPAYMPAILTGIQVHPENPLQFDFIVNDGDDNLRGEALKGEAQKMIKYFLASLTIPENDLWVNLSPYEKDRIIPEGLSRTDIGRELLAQDYVLKQITASLIYPEGEFGKKFWDRIYKKAYEAYGTTEIPVDTFNKVWIMPDKVVVYEHGNMVFVAEASFKVMLEEDYLALSRSSETSSVNRETQNASRDTLRASRSTLASDIVREIVIPELQKEVNAGKNFASLRQVYNALILAVWFKQALKESLLGKIYVDQNKTAGINITDAKMKDRIYQQYLNAYQKGVYNYIKPEYDQYTQKNIPRKYFSGGIEVADEVRKNLKIISSPTLAQKKDIVKDGHNTQFTAALASADSETTSSGIVIKATPTEVLVEELSGQGSEEAEKFLNKKYEIPLSEIRISPDETQVTARITTTIEINEGEQIVGGAVFSLTKKDSNWFLFIKTKDPRPDTWGVATNAHERGNKFSPSEFKEEVVATQGEKKVVSPLDLLYQRYEETAPAQIGILTVPTVARPNQYFLRMLFAMTSVVNKIALASVYKKFEETQLPPAQGIEAVAVPKNITKDEEGIIRGIFTAISLQEQRKLAAVYEGVEKTALPETGVFTSPKLSKGERYILRALFYWTTLAAAVDLKQVYEGFEKTTLLDPNSLQRFQLANVSFGTQLILQALFNMNALITDRDLLTIYAEYQNTMLPGEDSAVEKTKYVKVSKGEQALLREMFEMTVAVSSSSLSFSEKLGTLNIPGSYRTPSVIAQKVFDVFGWAENVVVNDDIPLKDFDEDDDEARTIDFQYAEGAFRLIRPANQKDNWIVQKVSSSTIVIPEVPSSQGWQNLVRELMTAINDEKKLEKTESWSGGKFLPIDMVESKREGARNYHSKIRFTFKDGSFVTFVPRNGIWEVEESQGIDVKIKRSSSLIIAKGASSTIELPKQDSFPGYRDLKSGQMFFGKYDKVYPLAKNFFLLYGGNKENYQFLRTLSGLMNDLQFFVGETKDDYADVDAVNKKITINAQFFDHFIQTGYKKISLSFLAGLIAQIYPDSISASMSVKDMEILIGSSKKSLMIENGSRLDDVKALYQLKKKVAQNDTRDGAKNPYYLTDADILLFISDMLHRGKTLNKRSLVERLTDEYLLYGKISEEKAEELLKKFWDAHPDIVVVTVTTPFNPIENLRAKLEPDTEIEISEKDSGEGEQKVVSYSLNPNYVKDPAFKGRALIDDIEVERQDEKAFGGKTAHTGEMQNVPYIVTLPNFASAGEVFQDLFSGSTTKEYLDHLEKKIAQIIEYKDSHLTELNQEHSSLPKEAIDRITKELALLGIAIEPKKGTVIKQIEDALTVMEEIDEDLRNGSYANLSDYFQEKSDYVDKEMLPIRQKIAELFSKIEALEAQKKGTENKEIDDEIATLEKELQNEQFKGGTLITNISNKLAIGGRLLIPSQALQSEMKEKLKELAQRLGIPLNKLVLAIRSSAVGEDSETASFAGRQDTYIFVTPFATESDQEGLDLIITNWVFNQASLFNKRAIEYRSQLNLPTFDKSVEISTLFQEMFLSQISWIGFSVDRESGFPLMTLSATEGQGELLVSGQETGDKNRMMHNGQNLDRVRGARAEMIIETPDGLGKMRVEIPEEQRNEFVITDKKLLSNIARYFKSLHDYYGSYVDLEGALRVKRDKEGNPIYLRDEKTGEILLDERGFKRYDWMIVSTQARPETVRSQQDPHKIYMKQILITEKSYQKALDEGKVLPLNFLAKTGGVAQGQVFWISKDDDEATIAQAIRRIMLTEQSDPDMNEIMRMAKGIVALRGGPNSHTMIVASEYGLVALSGSDISLSELQDLLPNFTKITIDANRGKILKGTNYTLQVQGKDFRPIDLPAIEGDGMIGVFAATANAALPLGPFAEWIYFYGIGLDRQELTLTNDINIYPDLLLAYDNMIRKEHKLTHDGPILNREKDQEKIKYVEEAIRGFKTAEDFYMSKLTESILTKSITTVAPLKRVLMHAQTISDYKLRLKVLDIVEEHYKEGVGKIAPIKTLKKMLSKLDKDNSDAKIISEVIKLLDKRHYIRLDDRKSDEYKNLKWASEYINEEANPMKGFRGLDLMLSKPQTLRWQLRAIKNAIDANQAKYGIFAPVVRRPGDVIKFLTILYEEGLINENIKVGIMTELPTNSIDAEDYFMAVEIFEQSIGKKVTVDFFTSTGGNDGLQTLARIDRNAINKDLQDTVKDRSLSVLRWNMRIPKVTQKFNTLFRKILDWIRNNFCGNAPSLDESYAAGLIAGGINGVSLTPESSQRGAIFASKKTELPKEFKDAIGFDFDINPPDVQTVKIFNDHQMKIGTDFNFKLPFHYRVFKAYDEVLLPKMIKGEKLSKTEADMYHQVRELFRKTQYLLGIDESGVGMRFYKMEFREVLNQQFEKAQAEHKRLVIGIDATFSDQYYSMPFGDQFEPKEANPELGVHGLVKALHGDLEFFKAQLSAIKSLAERIENPKDVILQIRVLRNPKEIDAVRQVMEEVGLDIPISLDVEVPAALYETDEILDPARKISEISIVNPLRLVSDKMALELNNTNGDNITQKDQDYQLIRPIMILATAARKAGIPFSVGLPTEASMQDRLQFEAYLKDLAEQTKNLPRQNKDTGMVFYIHPLTGKVVALQKADQKISSTIVIPYLSSELSAEDVIFKMRGLLSEGYIEFAKARVRLNNEFHQPLIDYHRTVQDERKYIGEIRLFYRNGFQIILAKNARRGIWEIVQFIDRDKTPVVFTQETVFSPEDILSESQEVSFAEVRTLSDVFGFLQGKLKAISKTRIDNVYVTPKGNGKVDSYTAKGSLEQYHFTNFESATFNFTNGDFIIVEPNAETSQWQITQAVGKSAEYLALRMASFTLGVGDLIEGKGSQKVETTGGIDFASIYEDLKIKTDASGSPLAIQFQDLDQIQIDGFIPVIIQIVPIHNLPFLLGFDDLLQSSQQVVKAEQAIEKVIGLRE